LAISLSYTTPTCKKKPARASEPEIMAAGGRWEARGQAFTLTVLSQPAEHRRRWGVVGAAAETSEPAASAGAHDTAVQPITCACSRPCLVASHLLATPRNHAVPYSVNMFGPLLRLPFFCLSPVLFPHLPGVRASNRSWQLSRSLAPA
jgi:hypothetical protein